MEAEATDLAGMPTDTNSATKRDRFSLRAWAEMRGFEPRHVLALTGAEAKALSEAARAHDAADAKAVAAHEAREDAAQALVPFLDKLKAIKAASA